MLTQRTHLYSLAPRGAVLAALVLLPTFARAEYQGKVQILLLGDSATEASALVQLKGRVGRDASCCDCWTSQEWYPKSKL